MSKKSKNKVPNLGSVNITLNDWRAMHPFGGVFYDSDGYYHRIANKVGQILINENFVPAYSLGDVRYIALCLAAYFEDVVSELCIFRAFIHEYRKTFSQDFPWYEIKEEYLDDEVNLVDVQYVMWQSMFARRDGSIPNPENLGLLNASRKVYDLFIAEFEKAPVNKALLEDIYDKELNRNDPAKFKTLLMWIACSCYMFPLMYPARRELDRTLEELHNLFSASPNNVLTPAASEYMDQSYRAFAHRCGPLAKYPQEWYVLMCQQREFYDYYLVINTAHTPVYSFAIIDESRDKFKVCSCRGQEYWVVKNSFSQPETLGIGDTIVGMLFSYGLCWHVCGLAYTYFTGSLKTAFEKLEEMAEKLVDEGGRKIDLVGQVDEEIPDNSVYGLRYDALKCAKAVAFNNGSRLFYFKNLATAERWLNKNLIGKSRRKKTDIPELADDPMALLITQDNHVIISNATEIIHDPANPYYDPDIDVTSLMMDSNMLPNPLCKYMLNHRYCDQFSLYSLQGQEYGRKLMQNNIRFFLTMVRQYPF